MPARAIGHKIDIPHIIIAVVYKICFKARRSNGLQVHRHKSQVCTEPVAAFALLHGRLERYGAVCRVVILVFAGSGLSLSLLHLVLHHTARAVVIVVDHNHVAYAGRNLEAVLVLHQHDVLSLETGDTPAADFAQEAHLISYLHISCIICFKVSTMNCHHSSGT